MAKPEKDVVLRMQEIAGELERARRAGLSGDFLEATTQGFQTRGKLGGMFSPSARKARATLSEEPKVDAQD